MSADLEDDFPLLCATCLGPDPLLRMTRQHRGKPCKVCERPFTIYRWKPGKNARMKKTELCKPCAQAKHVCQTCVLDIECGLPVQLRDKALAQIALEPSQSTNQLSSVLALPSSSVGTNVALQRLEADGMNDLSNTYSKLSRESSILGRLAKPEPYYKRNEAHLCSYFARGECNRGELCPFRHEMPHANSANYNKQNIKDRYKGNNDPVAMRMMDKITSTKSPDYLEPPVDQSITTLWVGRLQPTTTETELQSIFGKYGIVQRIHIHSVKSCAFVTYASRADAEAAVKSAFDDLRDRGFSLSWAKAKATPSAPSTSQSFSQTLQQISQPLGFTPHAIPPPFMAQPILPPPPGIKPVTYPSQMADYGAARLGPD